MSTQDFTLSQSQESVLATNKVLRNTYILLSLTILFSAGTASYAMFSNAAPMPPLMLLVGYFGLLFLTQSLRNSVWGLVSVFAFTGFLGYTIGPLLNSVINNFSNGSEIITTSLGATGIIFFALSGYAMTTRKDFSYMGAFLFVGFITVLLASIANIFLQMTTLHLLISSVVILLSSGLILFQTSQIINGGERNYIMATITLYVAILNIFINLVQILSFLSGRD